jgi:YcaO-like protein with predicted kinase domain
VVEVARAMVHERDTFLLEREVGITRVANVTGLDRIGLPVASAIRPNTHNLSVSFGKGLDWESARLSAIMESAELYFSERPKAESCLATARALGSAAAINIDQLERRIDGIDIQQERMPWFQGRDLASGAPQWVPAELVSMDYTVEARRQRRYFKLGATGLAAAFDRDRAILHALLEVIERDSHQRWNEASDMCREMSLSDPHTVDCPIVASILKRIAAAGLAVFVWNMTSDLGVSCYLAEILDFAAEATTAYSQGAAADVVPAQALRKALLEAVQVRLTYIAGSRDDLEWSDYGKRYDRIVENRRHMGVLMSEKAPAAPEVVFRGSLGQIAGLIEKRRNSRIVVVDVTSSDDSVQVVKVIVPALSDTSPVPPNSADFASAFVFAGD